MKDVKEMMVGKLTAEFKKEKVVEKEELAVDFRRLPPK